MQDGTPLLPIRNPCEFHARSILPWGDSSVDHKASNTCAEIVTFQGVRLRRFLNRHGLFDQFLVEDAAGKR
jgi:hypothetical protein